MRIKRFLAAVLCCCGMMTASAQTAEDTVYVFRADQPYGTYFLPAPPDTASLAYIDDLVQFQWGKTQRNTPRGDQASEESLWEEAIMRTVIAEVLELDTINDETAPAITHLLSKAYDTGNQSTASTKEDYMRIRPFVQMNDPLWAKWDDDYLRTNSSYPSGHTGFGWETTLIFAEMWPELQDTLLRRGFQFGESRIITGAHYQSDVTAGYLCASASVAHAHTNPELQKDIAAARAEYARIKGLPDGYDPVAKAGLPLGEKILNDPVDTTSYRYIGDLMLYWDAKRLRDTPRGQQAIDESEASMSKLYQIFGEAMGITLNNETTPAISKVMIAVLQATAEAANHLKSVRFRKRPYVQLNDKTAIPEDEDIERDQSSFPSGGACLGWSLALAMVQVAPECQNEILRRGYDYGYNRLIVGYHWATDIDASRQLSAAVLARLNAEPTFRDLVQQARDEYLHLTTAIDLPSNTQHPSPITDSGEGRGGSLYDLQGRSLTSNPPQGLYISNGHVVAVK